MLKLILAMGVVLLVTLAGLGLWLDPSPSTGANLQSPMSAGKIDVTGGVIYAAKFSDRDGREHSLGEWQHKFLLINFWATWCAPCKEEMPMLSELQQKYASRGLQIVGIAADSRINVDNFAKNMPFQFPVLIDEAGAIEFSKRLGNRLGLLPFTIVLKPGGGVIFTRLGVLTELEMNNILDKYL